MTVSLCNSFLANARGFTFEDSASVTWSFNANTNQLTATATGGGGGGSSANPSATIGLSAVNGTATTFMTSDSAPPLSQAIAPTWSGAHIFSSTVTIQGTGNGNALTLSGTSAFINASGGTGLTIAATNNLTLTFGGNLTFIFGGTQVWQMASGAISQASAAGQVSYTVNGASGQWTHYVIGNSASNNSFGQQIQAGTSASDKALNIINYANTHTLLSVYGDGGMVLGAATSGDEGLGTINVAGGYYVNGTAVLTAAVTSVALSDGSTTPIYTISGSPVTATGTLTFTLATQTKNLVFAGPTTGAAAQPGFRALVAADMPSGVPTASANPSATIGLAAVNGSAATFMTSDSAPALSQGITPTWTGQHIFACASAVPMKASLAATALKWGLQVSASAGQIAGIGLAGNGTTLGSTDFEIYHDQNAIATLFNGSNAGMTFYTNGLLRLTLAAAGAATFAGLVNANAGLTVTAATTTLTAGTTAVAPLTFLSGTNLTAAVAGAAEYDGTSHYFTNETTSGRGLVPVEQYFHLTAAGGGITTIANFFGATSNISLVANAFYEIEIVVFFTMGSTGSVLTWTLTNSAAPTAMNLYYEMCPVTGIVAPPGTAGTMLCGQILNGVTAAQTVVTTSLSASSKQYARFRIQLKNGTGTSLKIQCAETTTTTSLTPNIGSFWRCKRIPAGNVGTFAA